MPQTDSDPPDPQDPISRPLPPDPAGTAFAQALCRHLAATLGRPVQSIETHISWVLLDGEHAWKIKKPIRLDFLDFRRADVRERLCREELRLNRRLAPDLYLDVVPIFGSREAPCLDGGGPAIDHAVRMREFPSDALFATRLADGRLTGADVDRLARRIAAFHAEAELAPASCGDASHVAAETGKLLDALESRLGLARMAGLRAWCEAEALRLAPLFEARRAGGRVRDCHGDLHLGNTIALGDQATAFDCIEFNPALRMTDVFADVAFMAMDLTAHGRGDLAMRFVDVWLEQGGDYDGLPVLRYYLVYRALVRAMVAALRDAGTAPPEPGPDYLALADRLSRPARPWLAITRGLSGSGKSVFAARLLERGGAIRLRADAVRKRLFGLAPGERSAQRIPGGIYGEADTARTYQRLHALAETALAAGWPTVVDATFLRAAQREAFRELAGARGLPFAIADCRAPVELLRARIAARSSGSDPSEADLAVLEGQLARDEAIAAAEADLVFAVDGNGDADTQAGRLAELLAEAR